MRRVMVTGGAGFIGSNLVTAILEGGTEVETVVIYDALTYAGNMENVSQWVSDRRLHFIRGDICDREHLCAALDRFAPDVVFHLAAESHVDRSIGSPTDFIRTNVVGTLGLLEAIRVVGITSSTQAKGDVLPSHFRLVHVSTDEVYGSIPDGERASEGDPYRPNSPYAASKAASDHLVRAYGKTYGLPVLTTHCSNNYGPYQFPEKLIPLLVLTAMDGKPLPVYGDGKHVRDWIHVSDHCRALLLVAEKGVVGQTYNIGASDERMNLEVVLAICQCLDELHPREKGAYFDLAQLVTDRPAHDRRYAIDSAKMQRLGFTPSVPFDAGIRQTVQWYLSHRPWCDRLRSIYQQQRLGVLGGRVS